MVHADQYRAPHALILLAGPPDSGVYVLSWIPGSYPTVVQSSVIVHPDALLVRQKAIKSSTNEKFGTAAALASRVVAWLSEL